MNADMNIDSLVFMRQAGRVRRFHCFTTNLPNPVGHHTFNILGILRFCVPEDEGVSMSLFWAAYDHDLPERHTGDIPSPFKRALPGFRDAMEAEERRILAEYGIKQWDLSPKEATYLKLADSLDGMWHCLEERMLGNTTLDRVFNTFRTYVRELVTPLEAGRFHLVLNHICKEWRHHNGPFIG